MNKINHKHKFIDLEKEEPETQKQLMRDWFYAIYEDPAKRTPYSSSEGGYLWFDGGPYNAFDELTNNFSGPVQDDLIKELADELNEESQEWALISGGNDYDQSLINDISKITNVYHNFSGSIIDIENLLNTSVDVSVECYLYKLLYVNVITAMETYLSDAFISCVVSDKRLMRNFVENLPEFKTQKFELCLVYREFEMIDNKAKKYLADTVWHNLHKIKPMYQDTLGISFPDIADIMRAVEIRHHIVHRNGKDKVGKDILIIKKDVEELINLVEDFIRSIENSFFSVVGDKSS